MGDEDVTARPAGRARPAHRHHGEPPTEERVPGVGDLHSAFVRGGNTTALRLAVAGGTRSVWNKRRSRIDYEPQRGPCRRLARAVCRAASTRRAWTCSPAWIAAVRRATRSN